MQQAMSVLIALFVALTNGAVVVPFQMDRPPETAELTQASPAVDEDSALGGQESAPSRMAEQENTNGVSLRNGGGPLRHIPSSRPVAGAVTSLFEPAPGQEALRAPVYGLSRHLRLSQPHPRAP